MPQVDLTPEELTHYTGRNPRPEDFDAFWDDGVAQMQRQDAQLVLTPAGWQVPGVECFELWFSGVGGARIHAKYLRPEGRSNCPVVLQFHGYSQSSGDWSSKLSWVQQGYAIAAMDVRGQGGLSEDIGGVYGTTLKGHIIRGIDAGRPERLFYRNVFLDAAQLARTVCQLDEVDSERIYTIGGSQGAALALAASALEPDVAKRCAASYPFLCDYLRAWELDYCHKAYNEIVDYFRRFDPTHQRADTTFTKLGYIDVQHLAPRIKAEVIMATGLQDDVCPPSCQFAIFNKISSHKQSVLYPDFGHEPLPGWADEVLRFINGA
ncbi:MAG: alpha/beta fold hydrolase [Planctomycetota bacterium]|nr:MAG: alpha/beta fold hydrolase [Planctomycetota bacterium]